jgi:hypothetical protein
VIPSEVAELLERVEKRWPHAPLPLGSADIWLEDLADVPAGMAGSAVKAYALAGERFPPTSGWVLAECQRAMEDGPPSFDDAADLSKWIPVRVFIRELYDPNGSYSPEATARAVALMLEGGAHEVACRFVQERGLRAVATLPDGERYALDLNQSADRRDAARHFRDVSVRGWQQDPRRGLGLERACRGLGVSPAELLERAAGVMASNRMRALPGAS